MKQYNKIDSVFKRDMNNRNHPFVIGVWSNDVFGYLQDNQWTWEEKVDGTCIRIMFNGKTITFGGKTDDASIPSHLINKLQEIFLPQLGLFLETFGQADDCQVCFYGEGFGRKIQEPVGSQYLKDDVDFYLFDVKIGGRWCDRKWVASIAESFKLPPPVVVGQGTIAEAIELVKKGFKSNFGTADAEGLILRTPVEMYDGKGNRIITKIKVRDFKNLN